MVTIAELLEWRSNTIDAVAEHFYDKRRILLRLADEIHDARPPETWEGLGTVSAWKMYDTKRVALNDLAAQVSDLAVTLKETAIEIKGAQDDLHVVLDQASGEDFTVNHQTGEVKPPKLEAPDPNVPNYHFEADQGRYERAVERNDARADEFAAQIEKTLERAEKADVGLAKAMADVRENETRGGSGSLKDAVTSQLPPSLDGMTPEEIIEKFGKEIAVDTMLAQLEIGIPVYRFVNLDIGGEAQYREMANGDVKMSLKLGVGAYLGENSKVLEAGIGAGGFTDFELTFGSKAEAEEFLSGLDDAVAGAMLSGPGAREAAVISYINEHDVTSAKAGLYAKGELGFETPYAEGGVKGRAEGWYDAEKNEYGIKIDGSLGMKGGSPESGVNVGGSFDFSGEVKTESNGEPKEVTFTGALTGEVANKKLGLDIPGIGSGGGGDVELKMEKSNVMWGEMNEALKNGDVTRAADIAMDHGQVVVRTTTVATNDQEVGGAVEGGTKQTSSQHMWVRPANTDDFVDFDPRATRSPSDEAAMR